MKLPDAIEREIREIEAGFASRGGQQAGPPRLRGLRNSIEIELQRHAEAVEKAYREGWWRFDPPYEIKPEVTTAWLASAAHRKAVRA